MRPAAALHQHLQPGETSQTSPLASPHANSCWLQVRSRAQSLLASALATFSFAYRDVVPRILQLLSPQHGHAPQHQFKVAATHASYARLGYARLG